MISKERLTQLRNTLKGELFLDDLHKSIYATDASVYRKIPLAVACPREVSDIQQLIKFAEDHRTTLIPRTAGTSLAGQCVGDDQCVIKSKSSWPSVSHFLYTTRFVCIID